MNPGIWLAQAIEHHRQGNLPEAEKLYSIILGAEPGNFEARLNMGQIRSRQGRIPEALEWIESALAINPGSPEALTNRGNALKAMGRPAEALASYDRALAFNPALLEGLFNRANLLRELHRFEGALADYDRALAVNPGFAAAWNNRGNVLRDLRRFVAALASYDKALALRPGHAESLNNRALALGELRRTDEALACCDAALAIRPGLAEAWNNRGNLLTVLKRSEEALESYERAFTADPSHPYALSGMLHAALGLCDFARTERIAPQVKAQVESGQSAIQPFVFLGLCDDPVLQRRCAENYLRHAAPVVPFPWNGARYGHDRIRLAYLSADFRNSAAAYLTAELFETHDRARFEVTAIAFGVDDGSAMRARLIRAFDRFEDVRGASDREVATLLARHQVDIAVDLMGYTLNARPAILSHRPCPVQVSWLGYPGTMAADFIDYVIADRMVLPPDRDAHFREKIVRLPHSYYPSDSTNAISPVTPSRTEAGLPERGFVFCCFNNSWKIGAPLFGIWMRLLAAVPGSILWLLAGDPAASENLRKEAARHGIDPVRLVFAERQEPQQHLARHRLADLFLDTLPYNAHTTASDALWAGLPVITCAGQSFCARVAASLLTAIGLPELVTDDLADYEALALKLACEPPLLASFRQKLARNRLSTPLFDTAVFRHDLERAYERMVAQAGEPPRGFDLPG